MNESKTPFGISSRVVALKSVSNQYGKRIIKDNVYRVLDLWFCGCKWYIHVGLIDGYPNMCTHCGGSSNKPGIVWVAASLFAPYDPQRLEIPAELLEVTEERIDCKPEVKEVV